MGRIRSVHPDICVSEPMAGLPAELERTFIRLWTHCDDDGRCADSSKLIKAAIYPLHDEITFERLDYELDLLAEAGLIWRYEVRAKRYIEVCSWGEYQHPQRPRKSKIPACPRAVRDTYATTRGGDMEESWTGGEKEHAGDTSTREPLDITSLEEARTKLRGAV
jgi:hypothetical protein